MNAQRAFCLFVLNLAFLSLWPLYAEAQKTCPAEPVFTSVSKPTLKKITAGTDVVVAGSVQKGDAGTVQLCVDGVAQGNPEKVRDDGTFKIVADALKKGQKVTVQFTSSKSREEVGPASEAVTVEADESQCPLAASSDSKFQLTVDEITAGTNVVVTGRVKSDQSGTVRLCVDGAAQGPVEPVRDDGTFKILIDTLDAGQKVIAQFTADSGTGVASKAVIVGGQKTVQSSLYTLGLVGINATGSSASGPSQQYFASFNLAAPLSFLGSSWCRDHKEDSDKSGHDPAHPLSRKCWIFLDPRIASVPAAANTNLSSLSSPTSLASGVSGQNIGQITQSFEIQAGIEYDFKAPWHGTQFGWKENWARTTAGIILGGGSVTPFSPTGTAQEFGLNANLAQQFAQMPQLETQFPQLAAALCSYGLTSSASFTCPATPSTKPTSVAFLFPNRSRFYRNYFVGLRVKTFYLTGDCADSESTSGCKPENVYPGTFDVRWGQDETVTAGHLNGYVLTISGTYPVPGTAGTVRIFGSSYSHLQKNRNTPALVLLPGSKFVALDDPTVVIQAVQPTDQDYFRLGIGVDLIPLLAKLKQPAGTNSK
ncbi:MAG TPA: hypothetical protein VKP58_08370 [Candidatus Acidoferrum sp.]|nr:hypothetical protein [Candidatus Acidoferrum sp.]